MHDLLSRPTPKRPDTLRFEGRILYLADDSDLVRAQLEDGARLELTPELMEKLRDQISTDEITPAYICYFFDETLGEFPYLGLRCNNSATGDKEAPVERRSVQDGGFVCSVAGKRRGKGSSREQSPYAELMAGIRIVVGESIERIYNENCQNLGILTTTDFSILDRIEAGEDIPLTVFTEGKDDITRQIIEYGGLFEFNLARLQGKATVPPAKAVSDGPESPAASRPTDSSRWVWRNWRSSSRMRASLSFRSVISGNTTIPARMFPSSSRSGAALAEIQRSPSGCRMMISRSWVTRPSWMAWNRGRSSIR